MAPIARYVKDIKIYSAHRTKSLCVTNMILFVFIYTKQGYGLYTGLS